MEKKARTLITTALKETWKTDSPVIFLGEWCFYNNDKNSLGEIDYEVLSYHWKDYTKLKSDYEYLNQFDERLLKELVIWLNNYHNVSYSERYWLILIGPWLTYFIHVVFDRWESVRIALKNYKIIGAESVTYCDDENIPNNMLEFVVWLFSDKWNHYIYNDILKVHLGQDKIYQVKPIVTDKLYNVNQTFPHSIKERLFKSTSNILRSALAFFTKRNKFFIGSSYLGLRNELILNLRLGQLPSLYEFRTPKKSCANFKLRDSLAFNYISDNPFEKYITKIIVKNMPICFLEGYQSMVKEIKSLNFPKTPKVIFTSNFLAFDSLAMAYTAKHIENGAKLIHGQHGGYGIPDFMSAFDHELKIADRFIAWGDIKESTKIESIGIFKPVNQYKLNHSPNLNTRLLLVLGFWTRYSFRLDSGAGLDAEEAINESIRFADKLGTNFRKDSLLVRLYPSDRRVKQMEKWKQYFSEINFDDNGPIANLVLKSRLVVYSYNIGTGYLEFLSANVPTIAFWNMKASPISQSAEPFFHQLRIAGIFHDTPEEAALFIQSIWDDVEEWWNSESVQDARRNFCKKFANLQDNILVQVEKVLREELKKV